MAGKLTELENHLKDKILDGLKTQLQSGWDTIQQDVANELVKCAKMAAKITLRSIKGEDVTALKAHLTSQTSNLLVIAKADVVKTFWNSVNTVVASAGDSLLKLAQDALKAQEKL
jgi:hypothetical protein